MPRDIVMTTPALRRKWSHHKFWLNAEDDEWTFCADALRKLWVFPGKATYWLQLTQRPRPEAWKIKLSRALWVHFLNKDVPGSALLADVPGIEAAVQQLIPRPADESPPFYVRLFYRED